MAEAFKCDACNEMKEGIPQAQYQVGDPNFNTYQEFETCEECTAEIIDTHGLDSQ